MKRQRNRIQVEKGITRKRIVIFNANEKQEWQNVEATNWYDSPYKHAIPSRSVLFATLCLSTHYSLDGSREHLRNAHTPYICREKESKTHIIRMHQRSKGQSKRENGMMTKQRMIRTVVATATAMTTKLMTKNIKTVRKIRQEPMLQCTQQQQNTSQTSSGCTRQITSISKRNGWCWWWPSSKENAKS